MSDESSGDSEQFSPFGAVGPEAEPSGKRPRRAHKGVRWGRIAIVTIAVLFATMVAAVGYFGVKLNNSVSSISRAPSRGRSR